MKRTVRRIISLLLVLIISIGASIVAFAAETTKKSYEFNEETGELRLYSETWGDDWNKDLNIDETDVIESCTKSLPRLGYEFLLKVKSIFIGKDISYNSDNFSDLFLYTANLEKISADADNENVTDFDNVLYSKDKKTLLKCPIAREDKNVTIAEECTKFEDGAFSSLDLKKDLQIAMDGDNEYPNYRQKRVNLIFTKEGQLQELAWYGIIGREHYISNVYIPESQEEIDTNAYNNFSCLHTVSWIMTSLYVADESLYMIAYNKLEELNEKYNSGDTILDNIKIYGDLLTFFIEEGYADNLEDNIYGTILEGTKDQENKDEEVIRNCARICAENINRAINNKDCVRNLSSFIKDSEVVNGKCGENVYYQFTQNDGLLEIRGAGTMYSSDTFNETTFTSENSERLVGLSVNTAKFDEFNVKKLTIESGVTAISDAAFFGCNNLNSVCIIPENTVIGEDALPNNDNMQILAPKDSSVYNTLKGYYNVIPYSFTANKDDKDKPMLAFDGKVVLTEDMWSCICRLVKDTDVQYIYFKEFDFGDMMPEYVIVDYDKDKFNDKNLVLSIIKDGETIQFGMVDEEKSFFELVEALIQRFVFTVENVVRAAWRYILKYWK